MPTGCTNNGQLPCWVPSKAAIPSIMLMSKVTTLNSACFCVFRGIMKIFEDGKSVSIHHWTASSHEHIVSWQRNHHEVQRENLKLRDDFYESLFANNPQNLGYLKWRCVGISNTTLGIMRIDHHLWMNWVTATHNEDHVLMTTRCSMVYSN
jgi:hypothetical protein